MQKQSTFDSVYSHFKGMVLCLYADSDDEIFDISLTAKRRRKHTHKQHRVCSFAHKTRPCKQQQEVI